MNRTMRKIKLESDSLAPYIRVKTINTVVSNLEVFLFHHVFQVELLVFQFCDPFVMLFDHPFNSVCFVSK